MFGKHKGKTFQQIKDEDINYCLWVASLKDCMQDDFSQFCKDIFQKNFSRQVITENHASKLCQYMNLTIEGQQFLKSIMNVVTIKDLDFSNNDLDQILKIPRNEIGQFLDYYLRYNIGIICNIPVEDSRAQECADPVCYKRFVEKNASLNDIWKTSNGHTISFGRVPSDITIEDNLQINGLIDWINNNVKDHKTILCDPDLSDQAMDIIADADLIVDDEIIDFKYCHNVYTNHQFLQLLIYAAMYFHHTGIHVNKLTIFNIKHGKLITCQVQPEIIDQCLNLLFPVKQNETM